MTFKLRLSSRSTRSRTWDPIFLIANGEPERIKLHNNLLDFYQKGLALASWNHPTSEFSLVEASTIDSKSNYDVLVEQTSDYTMLFKYMTDMFNVRLLKPRFFIGVHTPANTSNTDYTEYSSIQMFDQWKNINYPDDI